MTQKELYKFAGKLNDKEAAFLIASYVEHRKVLEWGFDIDLEQYDVKGVIKFIPKKQ